MNDYISKPVNEQELMQLIEKLSVSKPEEDSNFKFYIPESRLHERYG